MSNCMNTATRKFYKPRVELGENCIKLYSRYEDREKAKSIPGRSWNSADRCWEYPLKPEIFSQIIQAFPGLQVDHAVTVAITEIVERQVLVSQIKTTEWENAKPVEPMPIKTKPFKHQVTAFNVACRLLGVSGTKSKGR